MNQNPTAGNDIYNKNEITTASAPPQILAVLSNDGYLPDAPETLSVTSISGLSCTDGR